MIRCLLALLLWAGVANAQVPPGPPTQSAPYLFIPLGYQQMTSLGSVTSLPSIPTGAIYAAMVCVNQAVNWRDDGVDPTGSVGNPLPINTQIIFSEKPLTSVRIIQTSASATCNVTYYK